MNSTNRRNKTSEGYKLTKLGRIPVDWEAMPFGDVVEFSQYGLSIPTTLDGNYFMFKMNHFLNGKMVAYEIDKVNINSKEFEKYKLNKEDILFNRTNSYDLVGKTAIFLLEGNYTAASYIVRFCINKEISNPYFINYFFNWNRSQLKLKEFATKGVSQSNINPTNLQKFFFVPIPPLPEQQKIARILTTWDSALEKTEQLITKKQHLKKGLMQQLLTGKKRLHYNVNAGTNTIIDSLKKKKYSAGDYKLTKLGSIPVEWEVKTLGDVCLKFLNGGTPSTKIENYWIGNIPWITGADFGNNKISGIRKYINDEAVKNSSTKLIPCGWLLVVTRTGVGKMTIAPFDIAISQDITGISVDNEKVEIQFLFWYLNFIKNRLSQLNQGTSISGITRDVLITIDTLIPPLPEQKRIAQVLQAADKEIENLKGILDKLKLQKKGLMQKLLTGQVRVKL